MDLEWLRDYDARELEAVDEFIKGAISGKADQNYKYPAERRFPGIRQPVAQIHYTNIWAQIPLYGTSILPLAPLPKEQFLTHYGLKRVSDIDKLIDLSKGEGRLHFALVTMPSNFQGCDFLEPLLRELNPPYITALPETSLLPEKEVKKHTVEFITAAEFRFSKLLNQIMAGSAMTPDFMGGRLTAYAAFYNGLFALGYNELGDTILNLMIDNPAHALVCLDYLARLELDPLTNPLRIFYDATSTVDVNTLQEERRTFETHAKDFQPGNASNLTLPHEIGKFIFKKLTLLPEGYDGCMSLMSDFDYTEIHSLMTTIQAGCSRGNVDLVNAKSSELSAEFEEMWKEANTLGSTLSKYKTGFITSLAVGGTIATSPILGDAGLLAGVGLAVLGNTVGPRVARGIARLVKPDYLLSIHDFQNRSVSA